MRGSVLVLAVGWLFASAVLCFPQDSTATTTVSELPSCTAVQQEVKPTNPWAAECPQATSFTVTNFKLSNNSVSMKVTYSSSVNLNCPNQAQAYYESSYNGIWDLSCDVDGLARVATDSKTWLAVNQNQFCGYFTGCRGKTGTSSRGPSTVAIQGNLTTLASEITCVDEEDGTETCTQNNPIFEIPITGFSEGPWILGFGAMGLDGTYLPDCGDRRPPWVTNTANCDAPAATGA